MEQYLYLIPLLPLLAFAVNLLFGRYLRTAAHWIATPAVFATLLPRIFAAREGAVASHRQIESLSGLTALRVEAEGDETFPLQVDGDFVGRFTEADFEVAPGSLYVVS